jgi:hypothetical protein
MQGERCKYQRKLGGELRREKRANWKICVVSRAKDFCASVSMGERKKG